MVAASRHIYRTGNLRCDARRRTGGERRFVALLCPNCLTGVESFQNVVEGETGGYLCPGCGGDVPLRYVRDYDSYPPIVLSLIGFSGHGKTVYVASLWGALTRACAEWPDFSYIPLDEQALQAVRERQDALERGDLPDATQQVFPRPVILRMDGVPGIGKCQLLVYDTSGEAFEQVNHLKEYGGYVTQSPAVVWLVSLQDLGSPRDLLALLTRYLQAVEEMRGQPKNQVLLVLLTKGDQLLNSEDAPHYVRACLNGDESANSPETRSRLSAEIEEWLSEQHSEYRLFARRVREEFRDVRFGVSSALGSAPDGRRLAVAPTSRGVMWPIIQLLDLEHQRRDAVEADRARVDADRRSRETTALEARRLEEARRHAERRRRLVNMLALGAAGVAVVVGILLFLLLRPRPLLVTPSILPAGGGVAHVTIPGGSSPTASSARLTVKDSLNRILSSNTARRSPGKAVTEMSVFVPANGEKNARDLEFIASVDGRKDMTKQISVEQEGNPKLAQAQVLVKSAESTLDEVESKLTYFQRNPPLDIDVERIRETLRRMGLKAAQDGKSAKELAPGLRDAYLCRIQGLRFAQLYDKALSDAQDALHRFPGDPKLLSEIEILENKVGR